MQRSKPGRVLAAVLFTDMVDSTSVAEELGDRRWKTLVDRHNVAVRHELKRFGGRELDTAGDGFFASFGEPASAMACACAASEAVRGLGIETRAGIHFGECERIGRKLGGITVVVGARIMGIGHAGDVLVSGTAAELARGAGFGFEDRGSHTLKGIDGEWRVFAVTSVDGKPRTRPLDVAASKARRAEAASRAPAPRAKTWKVAAVAIAVLVAIATAAVLSRRAGAKVPGPDTVARIGTSGGSFDQVVSLGTNAFPGAIAAGGGQVWVADVVSKTLSQVDPADGSVQVVGTPSTPTGVAFADGLVWITYGFSSDPQRRIDVFDPANSSLGPAQIALPDGSYPIAADSERLWIADPLGSTVMRYDTATDQTMSIALPVGSGPVDVQVSGGAPAPVVWVAAGRRPAVFRIDAEHPVRPPDTFDTGRDVPTALTVAPDGSVWVVSRASDSIIGLSSSGTTIIRLSLGAACDGPDGVAVTADAVWLACAGSETVVRLNRSDGSIAATIPVSGSPGPMTVDDHGAVWVTVRGT